ncbi:MAG: YhfC family intramembrane metalloprotease [Oscillospiraceae bacterium]|nr:YhfC family intramembrane metalloprotease [Oscillospiraceae bacterium]
MTFSTENIAAIIVCGLLALIIPIAAIIVYKLKNKDVWLPSAFIGAGAVAVVGSVGAIPTALMVFFFKDAVVPYIVLYALLNGIFNGIALFFMYKIVMKKHYSTKNAVMAGLGFVGLLRMSSSLDAFSNLIVVFSINAVGVDAYLENSAGYSPERMETIMTRIEAIRNFGFANIIMAIIGFLLSMTLYVCMSVCVYKAISVKGKLWLLFVSVLFGTAFSMIYAMYNQSVIGGVPMYIAMSVLLVPVVIITVILTKKFPDKSDQTTLNWR